MTVNREKRVTPHSDSSELEVKDPFLQTKSTQPPMTKEEKPSMFRLSKQRINNTDICIEISVAVRKMLVNYGWGWEVFVVVFVLFFNYEIFRSPLFREIEKQVRC